MTQTMSVEPIGVIRSPIRSAEEAPRQGREARIEGVLEVEERYREACLGLEPGQVIVILYWMHMGERDRLQVHPRGDRSRPLESSPERDFAPNLWNAGRKLQRPVHRIAGLLQLAECSQGSRQDATAHGQSLVEVACNASHGGPGGSTQLAQSTHRITRSGRARLWGHSTIG